MVSLQEIDAAIARKQATLSQPDGGGLDDIDAAIARKKADSSGLGTFADQGLQGATFGLSDEIKSYGGAGLLKLLDAVGLDLTGGKSYKEMVDIGLKKERANIEAQQAENPGLSAASQLLGGVGTGLGTASTKAGKAVADSLRSGKLLPSIGRMEAGRLAKGAAVGAGSGAAYGAGTGEGADDRLRGAKEGAVSGALVGAALPAAGAALTTRPAKLAGKVVSTATAGTKNAILGRDSDKILADRLRSQNLPALREQFAKGSDVANLADVAGDEVKGLLRAVARTPGGAKDEVANYLKTRSEGASKRIINDLSSRVSNVGHYFRNLDEVAQARSAAASPLYKEAFDSNKAVVSKEVDSILETPAGQRALKDAVTKMRNDRSRVGIPSSELAEQAKLVDAYVPGGIAEGLNLRTLDYVKRALNDQYGELASAGKTDAAGIIKGLEKSLVKALDGADVTAKGAEGGAYSRARKIFSDSKALENAQEMGLNFSRMPVEEIQRTLKDFTPGELDAFKIGVRTDLQKTVSGVSDGGDPAKRIFGSPLKREQLEAVFEGDRKGFQEFAQRMHEEISAADTKFKVLGGSRTDFNLAEDGAPFVEALVKGGVKGASMEGINALATKIGDRYTGLTRENSIRLAKTLTDKELGLKALDRVIEANKKNPQQYHILLEARKEIPAMFGLQATINQ